MIRFILESQNMPFTVSLTIMFMIAILEGLTTMIGMGLSSMVESFIPDIGVDLDTDLDHPDISSQGVLTKTFGWFRIGQVPFLIILIAFLTIFGLAGLIFQSIAFELTGRLLPGLVASALTFTACLPVVRFLTGIIAKILPKDETEAVAEKTFIGRVAVITLGTASKGSPAQAKLKDKFGTTHYLMVEPDQESEKYHQGDHVLVVKQISGGYTVIQNSISALQDPE